MSIILGLVAGIAFFIFEIIGIGGLSGAPFGLYVAYIIPAFLVFIVVKCLTSRLDQPDITPEGKAIIDSFSNLSRYGLCASCGTYTSAEHENRDGIFCDKCFYTKLDEDETFNVCDNCGEQSYLLLHKTKDGFFCSECFFKKLDGENNLSNNKDTAS